MDGLPTLAESSGCHGGRETMLAAAQAAGKTEVMARLMADYPRGPHDQPQSMCPAFGSLRVGLRMKRTATILSGSACCVYGLTFTSHFYGARRSVGYVPFNSETLVTGKLFEDIRDAVRETARPEDYDAVVVINLCVPTASGVPLDLLPKQIDGVRIIGIDVPGFGVPTHAEAKDVLAGAMLRYARQEAEAGPVARPKNLVEGEPTIALIGELFPADPMGIAALLQPMGLSVAPQTPSREWRDLYAALDCVAAAAVHPFYTASIREFRAAGRPIVPSGPVGVEGTSAWLEAIGRAANLPAARIDLARSRALPAIQGALAASPIAARVTVSGYEGSELLVARLLIEAGAEVPYAGTACPRTEWSEPDRAWLEAHGCHVQYRASLEQDVAAMEQVRPDLAIGTTPLVQRGKELGIPSLYFTNMVSARPLFGPAGAASMAAIVAAQTRGRERFGRMVSFFEGVGTKDGAGYGFTGKPVDPPGFRERQRKLRAAKAKAEEAVGT
ncbi:chlorophyllide a reductase subunit Y [Paracraurococcus ruber]|uniref:Chlorophyllide a reductase subunit Y n=1 Tax=Paracraurococcus ruber TaxID=77675 RepID=A0ABS1CZ42_9PROT|nr:chlorophyllide a reductase subunit Y [Paracraurococcus ruber]MBK1659207.1 chlorophyllide a reductase subunit Y [Paracraurococcus ruber]TDG30629.1 chlorophyllide a reductase subunit Y [Paracraurococcus ruber]